MSFQGKEVSAYLGETREKGGFINTRNDAVSISKPKDRICDGLDWTNRNSIGVGGGGAH